MHGIDNPYATFGRYSADLCLFLLVADQGQLSLAAKMAGLSQPRMSQRMRFLEDSLGKQLFLRERRGITLTPAGLELLAAVSAPLGVAVEGFVRYRQNLSRGDVVILSDIAFASFRLLPVFASLCSSFHDLGISLLTVQQPRPDNLSTADLIIRMEEDHAPADNEICLFRETVSALSSPAYRDRHPGLRGPGDLLDKTLIELTASGAPQWFTWDSWLRGHGINRKLARDHLTFNSYDHVVRAAVAGLGVCLGWKGLVDDLVDSGALVQAIPGQLDSTRAYYLRIAPRSVNRETCRVFDWLAEQLTWQDLPVQS